MSGVLPLREPFDLAVMIYDSLNYLLHPEDILHALREVKQVLRPQGLLHFRRDPLETCSRRHFADTLDFEELYAPTAGNVIRVSRYDARSRMQLNPVYILHGGKKTDAMIGAKKCTGSASIPSRP